MRCQTLGGAERGGAQEPSAMCSGGRVGVSLRRRDTVGETGRRGEGGWEKVGVREPDSVSQVLVDFPYLLHDIHRILYHLC